MNLGVLQACCMSAWRTYLFSVTIPCFLIGAGGVTSTLFGRLAPACESLLLVQLWMKLETCIGVMIIHLAMRAISCYLHQLQLL